MRTWIKRAFLFLCVVLLALLGYIGYQVSRIAPIATGYTAKIFCSNIFISGQDPDALLHEMVSNPILDFVKTNIDREQKQVTASIFGLATRRAIYRDGLGCTLLPNAKDEINIEAGAFAAIPPRPDEPWPIGEHVYLDRLPEKVDEDKLTAALDRAFAEPDPSRPRRTRSVVVVYNGHIIAERYAPGFSKDTPQIGWSMTKSVTNALVGILVAQGKLSIEDRAPVPEWDDPSDTRNEITIDQLLRMSSGLAFEENYDDPSSDVNVMLFGSRDAAAIATSKPLATAPDSVWSYSSGTANIISRIIREAVSGKHEEYLAFPRRALFYRIGMRSAVIEPDASGTFVGSSFMYATARDWARFGLLYLQDGVWEGERILPEGWVEYSTTPTPRAPQGKYGVHFWLNAGEASNKANRVWPHLPEDIFWASGFDGQYVVVVPSRKLVIVRLGLSQSPTSWNLGEFVGDVLKALPLTE